MAIAAETILNTVRTLLNQLGQETVVLANTYPEVVDIPELKQQLTDFQQAHQEATERLKNPTLSIATLGTTSSGKSTIVNALIGRRIAPIEAGEMSGGVLKLVYAQQSRLVIEATQGASWETGEWTGLSDRDIYDRIQSVMLGYHNLRRHQKDCIAPQVTVYGPLLPACDRALLNLPPGIGIEIIDLPGLKSIQDKENLQIIQPQVSKSCSLVALDYGQVDEEHRKRLLEELKEVVTYLNGRTDSMIFVLNRVDKRGADDFSLEDRIATLKEEIQAVLSLPSPPEIIPFSARLLYYAQCAWGTDRINWFSLIQPKQRLSHLKAMFQDCAGIIQQRTSEDKALRQWFREVEDRVFDNQDIDDETMRKIYYYALDWSGGKQLWEQLNLRVQESFPQIIVSPALIQVERSFDALISKLTTIVKIRKSTNIQEIENEIENISKRRREIEKEINKFCETFKENIQGMKNELKENTPTSRKDFEKRQIKNFKNFRDIVDNIKGDINSKIITPVRDALNSKQSAFDLEDKLKDVISPVLAKEIARAYDKVKSHLEGFEQKSGYFVKSVRQEDSKGKKELDLAEMAVRKLYQAMRDALSNRADLVLQGQTQVFEIGLQGFAQDNFLALSSPVKQKLGLFNIDQAILSEFQKRNLIAAPQIPDDFFELQSSIDQTNVKKLEKIGTQERVIESGKESSCFSKEEKTKTEDIYEEVKYKKLILPDFDKMADQWRDGIAQAESRLWEKIGEWLAEYLNSLKNIFDNSVDYVLDMIDSELRKQLRILKEELEVQQQSWQKIEAQKDVLILINQQLKATYQTSNK